MNLNPLHGVQMCYNYTTPALKIKGLRLQPKHSVFCFRTVNVLPLTLKTYPLSKIVSEHYRLF